MVATGAELPEETAPVHLGHLQVEDDGPGVPREARDRLFEPFFTTKPGGTGLGLAVSRTLARAHGGDLRLVDGEAGARFELLLPRAPAVEIAG